MGHDPAPPCGLIGERTIFLTSVVLRLGTASLTCKDGPYVPSPFAALLLHESAGDFLLIPETTRPSPCRA